MSNAGNLGGFEQRMGESSVLEGAKQKAGDLTSTASDLASQALDKAQQFASSAAAHSHYRLKHRRRRCLRRVRQPCGTAASAPPTLDDSAGPPKGPSLSEVVAGHI
jgi:hypothetical protein